MAALEESKLREDVKTLVAVLMELYYAILSLEPTIREHTRILAKGYEIALPLDFIRCALIVKRIASILKEICRAIYSPARILIEELKISNTIEGRIDVPLTSKLMGQGLLLVASRKRKLALESIENIFLKAFLKRLENDVELLLDEISGFTCDDLVYEEVFKTFTENIRQKLTIIGDSIKRINERTFMKYIRVNQRFLKDRALKRLAWKVLERNTYPYSSIASWALEYIKTNMLALLTKYEKEAKEISNLKLELWDYKLYEVYTYYVVTYTIAKILNASSIFMWKDEILLSLRDKEIRIMYDKVPKCKSWIAHGKHHIFNGNKVSIPAGRPDVSIHVNDLITSVCDAKYRVSARELSESRFKVLGYMHEYNAPIGALVFDPTHVELARAIDQEVEETTEFIRKAMNYGGIIVEDKNKTLYIVALEPKPHTELLKSREYKALEDMVKKII